MPTSLINPVIQSEAMNRHAREILRGFTPLNDANYPKELIILNNKLA